MLRLGFTPRALQVAILGVIVLSGVATYAAETVFGVLGLGLAPSTARPGLEVRSIIPGGPAADKGIKIGDIILEVNGVDVRTIPELEAQLAAQKNSSRTTLLLKMALVDGGARFYVLRPPKRD